jgi:signal recognition particle subunit SRP54
MGIRDRLRTMKELTQGGLLNPGARLTKKKMGTGKRLTPKERAKLKKLREREARRRRREARRKEQ